MNITIDDTGDVIVLSSNQWTIQPGLDTLTKFANYSSNQWITQPTADTFAKQYFQNTYHATKHSANVTFQFSGTAVYIYGSKGPGHSDYTMRWSNRAETLSARASTFQPQQLLWSRVFPTDGSEGGSPHAVGVFTNATGGNNSWFDIDFIILTTEGTTDSSGNSSLSTNPAPLSSMATSTSNLSSSTNTATNNNAAVARTIVGPILGSITATICLFIAAILILKKHQRRLRKRSSNEEPEPYTNPDKAPNLASSITLGDPAPKQVFYTFKRHESELSEETNEEDRTPEDPGPEVNGMESLSSSATQSQERALLSLPTNLLLEEIRARMDIEHPPSEAPPEYASGTS